MTRVLYSYTHRAIFYIQYYFPKVQGLCGNMDGSIQNDYRSRNGIEEDVMSFALSYGHTSASSSEAFLSTDSCSTSFGNVNLEFKNELLKKF